MLQTECKLFHTECKIFSEYHLINTVTHGLKLCYIRSVIL